MSCATVKTLQQHAQANVPRWIEAFGAKQARALYDKHMLGALALHQRACTHCGPRPRVARGTR